MMAGSQSKPFSIFFVSNEPLVFRRLTGEEESDIEEPRVNRNFAMSPMRKAECSCPEYELLLRIR